FCLSLSIRRRSTPILFPYTTLFRSRESIIAKRLENVYAKDEILLHYLNTVPFSDNTFGIESAAKHFFNRSTAALTTSQGATLIRSEEHTSELQSRENLVCRLLLEKK